jgi:hypothetical protein
LRAAISACISNTDGAIDGASSFGVSLVMGSSSSWEEAMLDSSDQLSQSKTSDILKGLPLVGITFKI